MCKYLEKYRKKYMIKYLKKYRKKYWKKEYNWPIFKIAAGLPPNLYDISNNL